MLMKKNTIWENDTIRERTLWCSGKKVPILLKQIAVILKEYQTFLRILG